MVEFLFLNFPPLTNEILNEAFGTFRTRTVKSRVVEGGVYATHEVIFFHDVKSKDDVMIKQMTFSEELDMNGKNLAIIHDYDDTPCEDGIDSPKNRFQIVSDYSCEVEQMRFFMGLASDDEPKVLRGGMVQCGKCRAKNIEGVESLFKR